MDSVNPGARRAAAREKLAEARAAMLQAASAAVVKGDPLAGQLQALALCVGGLTEIYEASEDTRLEIAHTFRTQTDTVADDAIAKVHASGMSIVEQLVPKLSALTEETLRRNIWMMKLRTILWGGGGLIALMLVGGCFTYGTGYNAGRTRGRKQRQGDFRSHERRARRRVGMVNHHGAERSGARPCRVQTGNRDRQRRPAVLLAANMA